MRPHPFFVVLGRCSDGDRGFRTWVVCVRMTHEEANDTVTMLEKQRDAYMEKRRALVREFDERLGRGPGGTAFAIADEASAHVYNEHAEWLESALVTLEDDLGILDRQADISNRWAEQPEYKAVPTSDVPRTKRRKEGDW